MPFPIRTSISSIATLWLSSLFISIRRLYVSKICRCYLENQPTSRVILLVFLNLLFHFCRLDLRCINMGVKSYCVKSYLVYDLSCVFCCGSEREMLRGVYSAGVCQGCICAAVIKTTPIFL